MEKDLKRFQCPFLCGNCDLGSHGIKKCIEGDVNPQGCAYLIGLSDTPEFEEDPSEQNSDGLRPTDLFS